MPKDLTANLEALLAKGNDTPALRLALAARYYDAGVHDRAVTHAEAAVAQDETYSAAWKVLGRAHAAAGDVEAAAESYRRGIEVAERRGDRQAVNEMRVFLKRLGGSAEP